ncbi:3031_t:CDS:2 [Diversispora eburnea]|uniref:3031_t:CDS:1 n=1 Tax=Diversispora eburnea TaxID=1213867 RepID=A0A9N8V1H6_9GLOM|nr:3031_t:CDS:2 [Diversispora eburnea]
MSTRMKFLFLFVACFVFAAYADDIVIKVGNLKYDPQTLVFTWLSDGTQHDVVQSDSEGSCEASTKITNAIKTDLKSSGTWNYTITEDANTKIYYFCSYLSHCLSGMTGTINVVSSDTTSTATSTGTGSGPPPSSSTGTGSGSPPSSSTGTGSGSPPPSGRAPLGTTSGSSTGIPTGATSTTQTNSAVSFNSITAATLLVFVSSLIMTASLL